MTIALAGCRYNDTKDSIKDTYRGARDSVKDSYNETKDSIRHSYDETNRELNETIDNAKRSWREAMTPANYVSEHLQYIIASSLYIQQIARTRDGALPV